LCFWTKNPGAISTLYGDIVRKLQAKGSTVLVQATVTGYGAPLEPGVPEVSGMGELVKLIGSKAIRLRFDPIILGYTKPEHFKKCLYQAQENDIEEIIVNFLVPTYKGVGTLLSNSGIPFKPVTQANVLSTLNKLRDMAPANIRIIACAETHNIVRGVAPSWLGAAACADPKWAMRVNPALGTIIGRSSRQGCGCCYSDDYGQYHNSGGYKCPHGCLYCYAK
jgi:hypothetical protein